VHPEVVAFLAEFSDPAGPDRDTGVWPAARVLDETRDAEALIACMADRVDGDFLDRCPRLRVVAATLKGYDNFDAAACARRGVWLTTAPDTIIAPTAELAVGLILGIMRRVGEGDRAVRSGGFAGWRPQLYGTRDWPGPPSGSSVWGSWARPSPGGCVPSGPGSATATRGGCRPRRRPGWEQPVSGWKSWWRGATSSWPRCPWRAGRPPCWAGTSCGGPGRGRSWSTWGAARWSTRRPSPTPSSRAASADVFAMEDEARPHPDGPAAVRRNGLLTFDYTEVSEL
jgi:hypothetical protein